MDRNKKPTDVFELKVKIKKDYDILEKERLKLESEAKAMLSLEDECVILENEAESYMICYSPMSAALNL